MGELVKTPWIIVVNPGEIPHMLPMEPSPENLREKVGGSIQVIFPWNDPVALICNAERKALGLPLNRALPDKDKNVYDIIAGTFLLCGAMGTLFVSLSDELRDTYYRKFIATEFFVPRNNGECDIYRFRDIMSRWYFTTVYMGADNERYCGYSN